ncbi:MAG: hypothetical protein HY590_05875 [Candidatus Omnitrophica bacterium]|nr:hypothetical protein [Candidatus Omnitrophota bacterium]
MFTKRLSYFLLFAFLCHASFLSETSGESFRDYQVSKKALSDSFFGVRHGVESVGKGIWGLTMNTGKLLWYGTWGGLTQTARGAKNADQWLQKHLW